MKKISLSTFGYNAFYEKQYLEYLAENGEKHKELELIPARVTNENKERYTLVSEIGELNAFLKGATYYNEGSHEEYPTTGDFVIANPVEGGNAVIYKTLKRKSSFYRFDLYSARAQQLVAVNFDYVFIMSSLNHDFNIKRMQRYLVSAWQSGATPVVILTKSDLVEYPDEYVNKVLSASPGVDVFAISSYTNDGIDELINYLSPCEGKTIVFLGSSGVGKSSLVNSLAGKNIMNVKEIREDDSKGKHTTTHRQMITLESGLILIDTPGMRELGMDFVEEGLSTTFEDVEELMNQCRFSDCTHTNEPGCAINEALNNGTLEHSRWEQYQSLLRESRYAENKQLYLQMKQKRHKDIAKHVRNMKKEVKRK